MDRGIVISAKDFDDYCRYGAYCEDSYAKTYNRRIRLSRVRKERRRRRFRKRIWKQIALERAAAERKPNADGTEADVKPAGFYKDQIEVAAVHAEPEKIEFAKVDDAKADVSTEAEELTVRDVSDGEPQRQAGSDVRQWTP